LASPRGLPAPSVCSRECSTDLVRSTPVHSDPSSLFRCVRTRVFFSDRWILGKGLFLDFLIVPHHLSHPLSSETSRGGFINPAETHSTIHSFTSIYGDPFSQMNKKKMRLNTLRCLLEILSQRKSG
jgi:hypothetical protein